MRKLLLASAFLLAGAIGALAQTVVTAVPIPGTIQGQIVLTSATSTSLVAANVTMAPNSQALSAGSLYVLNFLNESTGNAWICIKGGVASATSGCTLIGPGAVIQITFPPAPPAQTAPTLYATNGGTIDFWN